MPIAIILMKQMSHSIFRQFKTFSQDLRPLTHHKECPSLLAIFHAINYSTENCLRIEDVDKLIENYVHKNIA